MTEILANARTTERASRRDPRRGGRPDRRRLQTNPTVHGRRLHRLRRGAGERGHRGRIGPDRTGRPGRGRRDGLPRPLLRRPGAGRRQRLLREPQAERRGGDRLRAPAEGAGRRAADAQAAGRPARRPGRRRRLLQAAKEDRPAQLRHHRSPADRRLHRPRRLPGAGQGLVGEQPGGGDRDDAGVRAARPRRGGVPHVAEVEAHAAGRRQREVRRLQRRRGRPRRVHGPQRPGGRSPQRHRGHGGGRAHDRGVDGLRLRPRRVSAGGRAAPHRDRPGPPTRPAGKEHPRRRIRLQPGDPHGLRGVRLRRRDGLDDLDRGQPGRAAPPSPLPRRQRTLGQADAAEQRRDLRQRPPDPAGRRRRGTPRWAPKRARAPRSSPWPGPSRTPAWSKSPSACPWAT